MTPIDPNEVWVYEAVPEMAANSEVRQACLDLLSVDERTRHDQFLFERHRHQFLVAHALVRVALSEHAPVDPRRWRFVLNPWGRPEVAEPLLSIDAPLYFNLSHTDGLVACVVGARPEIGIDVESRVRRTETVDVADRFFSSAEVRALRALPPESQHERFFEYWTLKESYIKARGMGLALPLDQFSFDVDQGDAVRVSFGERLNDDPRSWQFERFRPSEVHHLALAVRRGVDPDVKIRRRRRDSLP